MKMKWTLFGFLLLLSTAFVACNHDMTLRREKRIIGDWEFDKVRYFANNGVINADNITDEFQGVILTFYEDKTMEYKENGQTFTGEWDLEIDYSSDGSDFELIAFLIDENTNKTKTIIWDNVYFLNDKINATETFDNGERIEYRLEQW